MTLPLVPSGAHGSDGERLAAALGIAPTEVLDLSQSLNPVAPPVRDLVAQHLDALDRYPDPSAATAALATCLGVASDRVVLTNGGAEAIALVAGLLGRGWVEPPDFSLYERHLPELDPAGPRFRSNPHSPTGHLAAAGERAAVWDEAFYPLATGTWTRGDADTGSWVVGSLTKLFACPGLRMGYLIAPSEADAEATRQRQPQWSVGGLVAAVLPELLEQVDLVGWHRATAELRDELTGLLRRHGAEAMPSDANWVLVDDPSLRDALAPHAIAIRDCTSFGLPGTVRIAVPDTEGLDRLASALAVVRPS
jgi:histidinol-phosphate/aromatic aminotransferase/cobyric acid decarboxylase-like protein